jgi:hypothetical protein
MVNSAARADKLERQGRMEYHFSFIHYRQDTNIDRRVGWNRSHFGSCYMRDTVKSQGACEGEQVGTSKGQYKSYILCPMTERFTEHSVSLSTLEIVLPCARPRIERFALSFCRNLQLLMLRQAGVYGTGTEKDTFTLQLLSIY